MSSRKEFVLLAKQESANIRALCRQFGISPKTGYKLLKRYGDTSGTVAWTNGKTAEIQGERPAVYLSGLESLLTEPAQAILDAKTTKYPQTVSRTVSFNALKNAALDLLLDGGLETEALLEQLTALFLTNPCLERGHRNPPRKNTSARALLSFHSRQKKYCY